MVKAELPRSRAILQHRRPKPRAGGDCTRTHQQVPRPRLWRQCSGRADQEVTVTAPITVTVASVTVTVSDSDSERKSETSLIMIQVDLPSSG